MAWQIVGKPRSRRTTRYNSDGVYIFDRKATTSNVRSAEIAVGPGVLSKLRWHVGERVRLLYNEEVRRWRLEALEEDADPTEGRILSATKRDRQRGGVPSNQARVRFRLEPGIPTPLTRGAVAVEWEKVDGGLEFGCNEHIAPYEATLVEELNRKLSDKAELSEPYVVRRRAATYAKKKIKSA